MNVLNSYMGGVQFANQAKQGQQQAAAFAQASQRQNKLAAMMEDPKFVAGLMSGDANALAGYAAATGDPTKALAMQKAYLQTQGAGLQNDAIKQDMSHQRQKFELAVKEQAATMSAQQRKEAANKTRQAVQAGMTVQSAEQWDQMVTSLGQPDLVGKFEHREGIMATYLDAADIMERFDEQNAEPEPYKPQSPEGKLAADLAAGLSIPEGDGEKFRIATPDESARYGAQGGQFGPDGRFYPINPPKGMTIETSPDGSFRFVQGADSAAADKGSPAAPEAMLESIEGILNDPALDSSTGILSPLQAIPGTPQKRFSTRSKQLEGQAFLQAFESLKGAGQITEIEGQKATQAIGRLDTAQSPDDYREALTDLQGVLKKAIARRDGVSDENTGPNPYIGITDADFGQIDIMSLTPQQQKQLLEARNGGK